MARSTSGAVSVHLKSFYTKSTVNSENGVHWLDFYQRKSFKSVFYGPKSSFEKNFLQKLLFFDNWGI
jgi:hypothetical protein